jgi:hypothetical protein
MANTKISALTAASTPVAGTEVLPIVQSSATVKLAISDLTPGLSTITTAKGGTNLTSFTSNGVMYASSASVLATGSTFVFNGTSVGLGSSSIATNFRQEIVGITASSTTPATSGTTQSASAVMRIRAGSGFSGTLDIGQAGGTGSWLQSTDTTSLGTTYPLMLNPVGGNVIVGNTTHTFTNTRFTAYSGTNTYPAAAVVSGVTGDVANTALYVSKYDNNSTTSQIFVRFVINNTASGSGQINANGASAAAFGSYSDRRLKENIVDLPSQLNSIMALRPVEFDYVESMGGGHQIGFIAQEVQAVYPDLVGEGEDKMFTLTDMNKNDARLIKCIQEQQALITSLAARVAALEAKSI